MKSFNLITLAVVGLVGSAVAVPGSWNKKHKAKHNYHTEDRYGCLKKSDVQELASAYSSLIGAFTLEAADKYLTDDWVDVSQSINTFLNNSPEVPDEVTFDKEGFVAAQQRQPGTPVNIISIPVVECTAFAVIWSSTFAFAPVSPRTVRGITVINATKMKGKKGQWMMDQWDVEFNSLSWNYNMGGAYCLPVPPTPIIVGDAICAAPQVGR